MLAQSMLSQLEQVVGKDNVLTSKMDMVAYSYDATADMPKQTPDVVVFPQDSDMVQAIVRLAREHKVPIYSRGAGTNLSGGAVPLKKS